MHLTQKHAEPAHSASKDIKECFGRSLWIRLRTIIKEIVAKEGKLEKSSFEMKKNYC
jgi:hypothetical protein